MLKRLFHRFKRFLQPSLGSQQTPSPKTAGGQKAVKAPPELTNADLEFLFTQLLEGVYQGRGEQWAQKYLQRMENRIPHQRWLQWLQSFGERLSASPTLHSHVAERMVQLGQLNMGEIGELAYEIGTQLLRQNLSEPDGQDEEQNPAATAPAGESLSQPYWEDEQSEAELTAPIEDDESCVDFYRQDAEPTTFAPFLTPVPGSEEAGVENSRPKTSEAMSWDDVLAQLQPNVASKLDELLMRLQQSASLVQELAQELIVKTPTTEVSLEPQTKPFITNDQQQAETWFYQGLQQAKTGDLQTAIASYDKALSIRPDLYEYWFNRGLTLFHLGRFADAIASYDQALTIKPDFYKAWYNRGGLLGELGRYDDAIACFDKVIQIQPDFHAAWSSRARTLCNLGRFLEAISCYEQALTIQPEDYEDWYYRGIALAEVGHHEEAIASYNKVLEIHSDFYLAWYERGLALGHLGRFEEAIACHNRVLEITPNYDSAWFHRGVALYNLGRWDDAIASLDQAIEIRPNYDSAWFNRGVALSSLGAWDEVIYSYDKAIEITPDFYLAWLNRGVALSNLGRFTEAIASLDQAIEIKPDYHEAWYVRGSALEKLGQRNEAIASYNKATQIKPDYHEVWIDQGVALVQLGRLEEAIASWDKALEIQPNFDLAWYNRGVALDNLKRYDEAVISYDKALEIQPNFDLGWYNRGVAMFYLARYQEAIASYDRALQIKPEYWEAWIGRGSAAVNSANCDPYLTAVSALAAQNPALNQRGYEGRLASYEEGLKYFNQETHPEAWGRLHWVIGVAHYEQGKKHLKPHSYWCKAFVEYNEALKTLKKEDFPQLHLEVLQDLIIVLLGLQQVEDAQQLQQRSTDLLNSLLSQQNISDESKRQLALKFAGLQQLQVDITVQSDNLISAWEEAERGKNACLSWLLDTSSDEISSLSYTDTQQFLNPTTAIIYWHISPANIHTFILKHDAPSPILISQPTSGVEASHSILLPEAVQRLREFEDWVRDWNQQYQDYQRKGKDKQSKSNHSWRVDMEQRLNNLKNILNISQIAQELQGIQQLILIPHRDLHKFPLHALFPPEFIITYLPNAHQNSKSKTLSPTPHSPLPTPLLSIENPNSTNYPALRFGKLESEAISQMFHKLKRIQGQEATKQQVENAIANDYNILHFTGYAIDNLSHPQKSALALTGVEKLTLEEICQKTLTNYHLVTLSARETAMAGNQTITSEYLGLVNGLLSRGVAHVVSTLWTVESAASTLVMIEFYRRRQPDKSEVAALAEATQWLKEVTAKELKNLYKDFLKTLPREELRTRAHLTTELYRSSKMPPDKKLYNHPYYWAAFTIAGGLG